MRARLINPQLLTITPIARASTVYDELAGEQRGRIAYGAPLTILAQVDVVTENLRQPGAEGPTLRKRMRLSFLTRDVTRKAWEPSHGDKVTAIADRRGGNSRAVAWYLTDPHQRAVEYSGPKLIVMDVEERPPSRATTEGAT